jgi:hypothetical protein
MRGARPSTRQLRLRVGRGAYLGAAATRVTHERVHPAALLDAEEGIGSVSVAGGIELDIGLSWLGDGKVVVIEGAPMGRRVSWRSGMMQQRSGNLAAMDVSSRQRAGSIASQSGDLTRMTQR